MAMRETAGHCAHVALLTRKASLRGESIAVGPKEQFLLWLVHQACAAGSSDKMPRPARVVPMALLVVEMCGDQAGMTVDTLAEDKGRARLRWTPWHDRTPSVSEAAGEDTPAVVVPEADDNTRPVDDDGQLLPSDDCKQADGRMRRAGDDIQVLAWDDDRQLVDGRQLVVDRQVVARIGESPVVPSQHRGAQSRRLRSPPRRYHGRRQNCEPLECSRRRGRKQPAD